MLRSHGSTRFQLSMLGDATVCGNPAKPVSSVELRSGSGARLSAIEWVMERVSSVEPAGILAPPHIRCRLTRQQ
jgi:hypothetical protein